ncbi:uncharacterized protein ACA1_035270 [Acanthamoeba castellanii str. Neff]|uniref:Uncharacterized protein n=1 Tax=Acanthamoeba castellanii (strain ATCC 30010 / Neff) TaxID=1257118 RepID=L8HAD5_ACACF|nr:uncharacterized protein ACA1_035270 [Acanthamoeba castellanii str. Neff]ELR22197.1 hypothetical protein ACA1_035270 [Acanthamoeba castellanii str. Neff]
MSSVSTPPPVKLTWSGSATIKPAVKHFNMPSFNGVTPSGPPNLTIASPTRAFNLNRSPRSPKILISSPATSPTTSRPATPTSLSFAPIAENSPRRTIEIEAGVESSVVVREEVDRVERHKEEEEARACELRERLRREQETSDALAAIECLLPGLESAPVMAREPPASTTLYSAPAAPTSAAAPVRPKADDALLRQQRELEAQREQLRREQAEWEEMKRAQQAKNQRARELDHHREQLQREQQEREQLQRELEAQKAQLQREKEQWERQKREMQEREEAELREKEAKERELKEQLRREKEQLEKEHQQLKLMKEKEMIQEKRKEEEKETTKEQQVRKEQELKEKLQKEKEQIEKEHKQMMERRENEQKRAQELKETQLREQQLKEKKALQLQQQQQQHQEKQNSQNVGHDDENVKNEDLSREALIQRFIRVMEGIKATTAGGDLTYQGETAVKAVMLARDISLRVDKHLDDQAAAMPADLDDDTFSSLSTSMDDIRDELLFVATTTARFIAGWRDGKHDQAAIQTSVDAMAAKALALLSRLSTLAHVLSRC